MSAELWLGCGGGGWSAQTDSAIAQAVHLGATGVRAAWPVALYAPDTSIPASQTNDFSRVVAQCAVNGLKIAIEGGYGPPPAQAAWKALAGDDTLWDGAYTTAWNARQNDAVPPPGVWDSMVDIVYVDQIDRALALYQAYGYTLEQAKTMIRWIAWNEPGYDNDGLWNFDTGGSGFADMVASHCARLRGLYPWLAIDAPKTGGVLLTAAGTTFDEELAAYTAMIGQFAAGGVTDSFDWSNVDTLSVNMYVSQRGLVEGGRTAMRDAFRRKIDAVEDLIARNSHLPGRWGVWEIGGVAHWCGMTSANRPYSYYDQMAQLADQISEIRSSSCARACVFEACNTSSALDVTDGTQDFAMARYGTGATDGGQLKLGWNMIAEAVGVPELVNGLDDVVYKDASHADMGVWKLGAANTVVGDFAASSVGPMTVEEPL